MTVSIGGIDMLAYFKQHVPVKQKLVIAFGLQSALTVTLYLLTVLDQQQMFSASTVFNIEAIRSLLSISLGLVLGAAIASPYVATVVRMEGLAAGDLNSPIEFTSYTDCVGRMAKAMCTFRDTALARNAAEADAAEIWRQAEAKRAAAEAEAAEDTRMEQMAIGELANGLARLAAGDLL